MDMLEFLKQTQGEVRTEVAERMMLAGTDYPYQELVFAEIVMQYMSEIGMTFEPVICHYTAKIRNANLRLSGYAVSDDADQIDLFVSLYNGVDEITPVSDSETKTAAEQCLRFVTECAKGTLAKTIPPSQDAYTLAMTVQDAYATLDQIRIYVITDRQAKAKNFKPIEVKGKTVKLEVMDIERLHRHWAEGKPRDEIVMNFEEICGGGLPCVYVPRIEEDYDCALTVFPGEALRFVYDKFGPRLLEANVRSFLSATGKVNKGIRDTLKEAPERFMAYNNGIVVIADEVRLGRAEDGTPVILWMKGMQIVNGGQTTASIYFTKKKESTIDLRRVRVPAKVLILHSDDKEAEEVLISSISRFANSQNAVRQADLSANKPFHVEIEKHANNVYCPDGIGRWFYERAAGSYNVMLAREGTTPARLRQLKEVRPTGRKITKTDLARYLNAWDQKPDVVSLGSQKNFERFMESVEDKEVAGGLPDVQFYKQMIAKAIIFKTVQKLVRPMFPAFQANVAAYLVSVAAKIIGDRLDFDKIWQKQEISSQMKEQLKVWAVEVNDALHRSSNGKMISEWAKKAECWELVRGISFSTIKSDLPEVK
ncbi:MAG: abortive phage infection protein [Geobacteraceae bacterium GWC2_58_44]|nr:MAG: abortive phage infection protein [Geobacteraceae bacterium GWC2_58_44]HBG05154.1 abortive phage infection protein [Geobacter sp.]